MTEPNIKHSLHRPDSNHDHWLEIYKQTDQIKVVKEDSKPVFNEDTYIYNINEDGTLEFQSGKHSCSGAGKFRSTSPSDKIDDKIRELTVPLTDGRVKH